MPDKSRLLQEEVILSLTLSVLGIILAFVFWKYPQNNPTPVQVVESTVPSQVFVPISIDSPDTHPLPFKKHFPLTEQEEEAIRNKYERRVKIDPNSDVWTDTGIILRRNQKIWVGSADRLIVNVNYAGAESDRIDNDMGEEEHGKSGYGYDGGDYIDNDGNFASALTLDTNFILGPKDFDTLKLNASYLPKMSAVDNPQDSSQDGVIIITVITDYDAYSDLMPGECQF
jgi:hypothetical protein